MNDALSDKILAGAASGLIADLVMHPIDTARARLWIQNSAGVTYKYRGWIHAISTISKQEGISALYKGFGIVGPFTTVAHALYFSSYDFLKKQLSTNLGDTPKVHFFSGLFANACGGLVWTPMDVVKQRLQVNSTATGRIYKNSLDGIIQVARHEGHRGLYKGYVAGLATFGPFSAVYFLVYEQMKIAWSSVISIPKGAEQPFSCSLVSGAVAGCVGAIVSGPLDCVKTRIQVFHNDGTTAPKYQSIGKTFLTIWREEGVKGFTTGMSARMMWIAPGCAITIAIYEKAKASIEKYRNSDKQNH